MEILVDSLETGCEKLQSRKTSHREVRQQNFQSIPLNESRKVRHHRRTFVRTHRKSANELQWASPSRAFIVSSDVSFSAPLIRPLEPFFTLGYNLLRWRRKEDLSDFSHFAFHSQRTRVLLFRDPRSN